jgi:DNA polymerase-3 subunit gamma/tau
MIPATSSADLGADLPPPILCLGYSGALWVARCPPFLWRPASVPSRRSTVNPARPGREQRSRSDRVPKSGWCGPPPNEGWQWGEPVILSETMSYTALARKWRPKRFEELTGQEHVLQALSNALATNRVHHAFLFTGTRGVGKTTIARILAKCLNCETGMGPSPCGECPTCREIDEGRFVDLIEVDAASRTKVDDTRELLDNVQYAPTRGRYKVYLIDEVHMLSTHSFNALLKTLEEPPPHVKFLLATTDPQKLPVTVLSRCLQFNLKRLSVSLISDRIKSILEAEGIAHESAAIRLVAEGADGSMRDGLSLLDQLIAFSGGQVTEVEARKMLATVDRKQIVKLAELIGGGDVSALLQYASELEQWAPDYGQLIDALSSLWAKVALKQAISDYEGDELHEASELAALAGLLSPEDVQLHYQTCLLSKRDLPWAPDPRAHFEVTLLRLMLFRLGESPMTPAAGGSVPASSGRASASRSATPGGSRASGASTASGISASSISGLTEAGWSALVSELEVSGAARQLAAHSEWISHEAGVVRLALDPAQSLLSTPALIDKLAQALSMRLGEPVRLEVEVGAENVETPARNEARAHAEALEQAQLSLENDPTVRAFKEKLGARLKSESVKLH